MLYPIEVLARGEQAILVNTRGSQQVGPLMNGTECLGLVPFSSQTRSTKPPQCRPTQGNKIGKSPHCYNKLRGVAVPNFVILRERSDRRISSVVRTNGA